jgi:hypothetical protein
LATRDDFHPATGVYIRMARDTRRVIWSSKARRGS